MKNAVFILLLLITHTTFVQSTLAAKEKTFAQDPLTFIENKGQVTDQYGNTRPDIQYKTGSAGMTIFISIGQLHYQFSKCDNTTTVSSNRKSYKSFNHKNHSSDNTQPQSVPHIRIFVKRCNIKFIKK